MRRHEWAGTALGACAGWPAALRFAISQMLASRMQVALFWGPDLLTFHNDAFAAGVGITDREAPGLPLQVHTGSSWAAVFRPQIEVVRARGVAVWAEDVALMTSSAGTASARYCDISFDPVRDEDEKLVGVLCFVSDTTARVRASVSPVSVHANTPGSGTWQAALGPSTDVDLTIQSLGTGLLESEARYRTTLNLMDEGFCLIEVVFDADGRAVDHRILEANPAFERHTGVASPVGKRGSELVPGGAAWWNDVYGRVVHTGTSEFVAKSSHDMQRWSDVFVSRVGDAADGTVVLLFNDAIERQEMKLVLQRRAEQFATLLRDAPLGVYLIDAEFRVREMNDTARATFAGVDDLIGRSFDEVLHLVWPKERADDFVVLFRRTLATGEPFFAPDDGAVRFDRDVTEYYTWQINRIVLPEGGYGVVCYFREISAQVHARQQLVESEARFRQLFDSAPMAVLACGLDGVVQSCNAQAVALFGREPVRGVDRCDTGLHFAWRDGAEFSHVDGPEAQVLRTGVTARNMQVVIQRDDGMQLTVMMSIAAQHGEAGEITGTIMSFIDISEQVRVEEALLEAQRQMVFVMDSMPQKIFTAWPDGTIGYLNPQWMQYTGLSDETVRDWSRAELIHPEDLPHTIDAWTRGLALGEPIQIEHRTKHAGGDYRWNISRALPMRDAQGQIVMWVGSSTDVHEQKQTAQDLQRSMAALADADQRKDEFLAMLAHELRNPLAPIRTALQIAQMPNRREDAVSAAWAIMNRQTGQMVRLVDELLDVSRISRGMLDLQRETVDLALVLEQAVETSRPAISAARHDLVLQLPSEPVLLFADVVRLAQVFGNLLNNAAKYTEPQGRIWLTAAREGDEAVVSIRDTGIGIPDDMLRDVFQMFRQVNHLAEHARGGLGIGLSLVERLVTLHGGSVTASSAGRGQGSEFVVRLPAIVAPATLPPAPGLAPEGIVSAKGRRRRVLVVDDNHDSADSMAAYLDMTGNVTATAYDGMEALEIATSFRPDLVLLDLGMPRLDGYETAIQMRARPGGASTVLVALSGWGQASDRQKTTDAGFDAHLVKPVDFDALEALLAGLPAKEAQAGD